MMKYCSLFLTILLIYPAVFAANTDENKWRFQVLLDDKEIGYHNYSVIHQDNQLMIQSKAQMDVKFLFFNAFRYRHSDTQTWNDNCLTSINARTVSNDKQFDVTGYTSDSGLKLETQQGAINLDQCVKTFAYWNPDILKADSLLNSQSGEYVKVNTTPLGDDVIEFKGQSIAAKKYQIKSLPGAAVKPVNLTIWYSSDSMRWLALESLVDGGRVLRYTPLELPAAGRKHGHTGLALLSL